MPIFEYECENGHRLEIIDIKNARLERVPCNQCDLHAEMVISVSNWQWGNSASKESSVSRAIGRVKKAGL